LEKPKRRSVRLQRAEMWPSILVLALLCLQVGITATPSGTAIYYKTKGIMVVLSDGCELVSLRTVTLSLTPRQVDATRREQRYG
jgi:hypothetical protein